MPTDLSTTVWRKAKKSAQGDDCVEVADLGAAVGVRDSKNPAGGHLAIPAGQWSDLIGQVRAGRFDLG